MTDSAQTPPQGRWFQYAVTAALVGAGMVAMSLNVADPDLWGHVQYGRDVLRDGWFHSTTTYAFSVDNYRWINHENLAELFYAVGANTVGPIGLLVFKLLTSLLVIGLILRQASTKNVGFVAAGVVVLLTAANLANHWLLRPQLFTYTYFALMICLLNYAFRGWEGSWRLPWKLGAAKPSDSDSDTDNKISYSSARMRWLWLAPVLFFFWANSHGGFVAGVCLFTAYLGCRSLEIFAERGWQASGLLRRFGLMIAASIAATLINPYGPGLHLWLVESLGVSRPEICEWWPPRMFDIQAMPIWLIVTAFVASWIGSKKSRDFTHLTLLTLTLWQMFSHQRHVPFFAILFGYWMAPHVESLLNRLGVTGMAERMEEQSPRPVRIAFVIGLLAAVSLLGYRLVERLTMVTVDRSEYPVAALQYMADEDLNGKLVVTYNWAQYAIAALGAKPETQGRGVEVALDGRFRTCYPQELVDMHFDFILGPGPPGTRSRSESSGPIDPSLVLRYKSPELVLINQKQLHSVEVMKRNTAEWALLYEDNVAQVWGVRWIFDNPQHPDYVPLARRRLANETQIGCVAWPALPERASPSEEELANVGR